MTDDLVTWLRAQLDEHERDARAVEGDGVWDVPSTGVVQLGGVGDLDGLVMAPRNVAHHMATHDPARVLAEVDTKRRILDELESQVRSVQSDPNDPEAEGWIAGIHDSAERFLHLLALPYADRPGYRDEWRP